MAYSKSELSYLSGAAQLIANENAELAQTAKVFQIPPQFYVPLNATTYDLPLRINAQGGNIYSNIFTGPGTAPGKFTTITKGQRMIEWAKGDTVKMLTVTLAGTGVEGTYFEITLADIQPPESTVPAYTNITFRVYFSALRSAGIPLSYTKVWETDFVNTWSDFQLRGVNPATGNPSIRAMTGQERWQFAGDDVLFMMPNEICVGQSNGCGADPWKTATDPATGTGTVRALRTEYLDNTANGGLPLRVIDGHGNDSSLQNQVPLVKATHRSGVQCCTQNFLHFRYGYFEVETWQPYTGGTWPVGFWLLPVNGDAGSVYTEIDVGENRIPDWQATQTDAGFAYHTNNYAGQVGYKNLNAALRGYTLPGGNTLYSRWVRYGCLWDATTIAFYIDGIKVAETPNTHSFDFMMAIFQTRTFGGNSQSGFSSQIYYRKAELWQSADPLDRQWLWINEAAPNPRSGYRFDQTNTSQQVAITNTGATATTVKGTLYESIGRLEAIEVCRTIGNCSTNQKRYAAMVVSEYTAMGACLAGIQTHGWSGYDQAFASIQYHFGGKVFGANASALMVMTPYASGDTVEMALDRANNKIWFRLTPYATGVAGFWNDSATDNPATNSGGLALGVYFPSTAVVFAYTMLHAGYYPLGMSASLVLGTLPSGFSYF